MKRTRACSLCLAFIFCAAALPGCGRQESEVCIERQGGGPVCVTVEIARTTSQRQLGLMYRRELPRDSGMLFLFEYEQKQAFTMKNTYIPLDMIFISADSRIAGIVENTTPLTEGPYQVDAASKYVLEVNGRFCRERGIAAGDRVILKNLR